MHAIKHNMQKTRDIRHALDLLQGLIDMAYATQGGRSQGSEMKRRQALELAKQPYQTVNSAQQAPAIAPHALEAPTLAPAPMPTSNGDAAPAPAPDTGTSAL